MPAHHDDTDQALFARVQLRDARAFGALYHRHFEPLYLAACRRLKDQEACRDIVQDVFLDLWQRAATIDNTNVEAYLHTAVKYQVFKQASRHRQSPFYALFDEMGTWLDPRGLKEDVPRDLRYKEMEQLIELWMDTLPEKRKQIFLLHYREQLSTDEIARRLNLSRKTVQNQLGLAFKDLRGKLPDVAAVVIVHTIFTII